MTRRVLVTGTSGFVGGAVGTYLRGRGWHVTGLSRRPPRPGAADVALAHDLTEGPPALTAPVDAVVHAAALSAPWGRPDRFDAANVEATRHVLAVAGVAHVVLISSSSVLYVPGDQEGLAEGAPPDTPPVNDYARTKRDAEALVRARSHPWAVLRPRAVFGVGDTVLFPRVARVARLGLVPKLMRDGVARGDVVSVDNLVRAVARTLERRAEGVMHLIDPAPVQIEAFLRDALARVGLPGPHVPLRVGTAMRLAAGLEGLSRRTGWWEPPLTRFGVDVLSATKTFDDARARARLGPPEVPTETALARWADWWRAGARLDDPAMARVGG